MDKEKPGILSDNRVEWKQSDNFKRSLEGVRAIHELPLQPVPNHGSLYKPNSPSINTILILPTGKHLSIIDQVLQIRCGELQS